MECFVLYAVLYFHCIALLYDLLGKVLFISRHCFVCSRYSVFLCQAEALLYEQLKWVARLHPDKHNSTLADTLSASFQPRQVGWPKSNWVQYFTKWLDQWCINVLEIYVEV